LHEPDGFWNWTKTFVDVIGGHTVPAVVITCVFDAVPLPTLFVTVRLIVYVPSDVKVGLKEAVVAVGGLVAAGPVTLQEYVHPSAD